MHMCTSILACRPHISTFGRIVCKALRLFCLISLLLTFLDLILISLVLLSSAISLLVSHPPLFLISQSFKTMVKKYRSVGFCLFCIISILFVPLGPKYWKYCDTPVASRNLFISSLSHTVLLHSPLLVVSLPDNSSYCLINWLHLSVMITKLLHSLRSKVTFNIVNMSKNFEMSK